MAKHKVIMKLPPREIKQADASLTLEISNGSVVWFPANTTYGHKMGWEKFHKLMLEEATRFETR